VDVEVVRRLAVPEGGIAGRNVGHRAAHPLEDDRRRRRRSIGSRVDQGADRRLVDGVQPLRRVVVVHAGRPVRREPLELEVGHRARHFERGRRKKGTDSRHGAFWMIVGGTEADGKQPGDWLPVPALGDERQRGSGQ
jgi:hypothetical protein